MAKTQKQTCWNMLEEAYTTGLYTVPEIADFTGIPYHKVGSWVRTGERSGLFADAGAEYAGQTVYSFLNLVEILVAGQLRKKGVSMQFIRQVYSTMQAMFNERYPFAHKRLFTDGKRVFHYAVDRAGVEQLLDVVKHQFAFPTILIPCLDQLEYDPTTSLATKWHIAKGIIIDPQRSFGKPIVEECGIPAYALSKAYRANKKNAKAVADWYDVSRKHVMFAVEFARKAA